MISANLEAKIISEVYFCLEKNFGSSSLGDFARKAAILEQEIQNLVYKILLEYLGSTFKAFKKLPEQHFKIGDVLYELRLAQSAISPTLEIWFLSIEDKNINYSEDEIEINAWGYFNKIVISLPSLLKSHLKHICALAKLVYDTSYHWLKEVLLKKLGELEIDCSVALYNYLRVIFKSRSQESLANNIWFGIFSEDYGYYLLDRDSAKHIVEILSERRLRSDKSPFYHLLNLIGLKLPYDKSISKHALEEGKCIDFFLPKVAYISNHLDFLKTEEQLTRGGKYSIFPVSAEKKFKLVAGFPSLHKACILPILKLHQEEFSKIYKFYMKNITKYIHLVGDNFANINWSELGDFLGGFFAGFVKSIHNL